MPIDVLRATSLSAAGFAHGFSTRRGGVSPAPFDSTDFALLRDPSALAENQRRLGAAVGFDRSRFFQASQVHGAAVVVVDGDPASASPAATLAREADALVAVRPGDAVAVRVADCVPVLLGDRASGRAAAAHAGWKGVEANVLGRAIEALVVDAGPIGGKRRFGAPMGRGMGRGPMMSGDAATLVAAIGPCIGPCCFEVGQDVADRIAAASSPAAIARVETERGKAFVDLRRAVRAQLEGLGVNAIEDVGDCTRCDAERFYSYRRDGERSGRLVGVIVAR